MACTYYEFFMRIAEEVDEIKRVFQEPGNEEEISRFIKNTFDFTPDLYAKIDVNGPNEDPLFAFLKTQQGGTIVDAIKWNFTKFLVNRRGEVVSSS